ncbi:MAG TPA: DUF3786 domain-containing protein [bacterium]
MVPPRNPLDVYRHLPRTNCGECGARGCMAFAAAVLADERRPRDCPYLSPEAAAAVDAYLGERRGVWDGQQDELQELRAGVAALDFAAAAARIGGRVEGGRLVVKCLGKDFQIAPDGSIGSDCHTHAGLAIPLLRYVLHARGGEPTGRWVPFRELSQAAAGRASLFEQRCERPLGRLLDAHTGLISDLIDLFAGERSVNLFGSDLSLVLYPLPRLPLLVCWWKPDEGMESSLHLFFDETAIGQLSDAWIHGLCAGLADMFEKIVRRHA